ncbi:MAG: FAD-dependent oxidoreductase [Alphaproteobacteria bacterium]|jgi:NADPH-dependent glutamate synthase beta subunit-like oxidoreductase/NAD(P)H-flavin reductase|nr:FAD-dependent oxidoreductase [Alphaproteobacteria bacterium]
MVSLGFDLKFGDLYERSGLEKVDLEFVGWLSEAHPELGEALAAARRAPDSLDTKAESDLILALAPHVDDFIARLFGIEAQAAALAAEHHALAPLYVCKRMFVQRRAVKQYRGKLDELTTDAMAQVEATLSPHLEVNIASPGGELAFARLVGEWQIDEDAHTDGLEAAAAYAAWATLSKQGRDRHGNGILFKNPGKVDPENLLEAKVGSVDSPGTAVEAWAYSGDQLRRRNGFGLTDTGCGLDKALDQANYCIFCHNQGKDSCSKGLREKPTSPDQAAPFKKSHFGVTLSGCPLEEKISEMHTAKAQGLSLAALSIIVADNPMVAATGHRICNDCMKACIFQRQEPVDIPEVETRTLKDVLALPWGFEIYSLLTRWSPMDFNRPIPKAATGKRVLVAGTGPAGFSLSHHLMNDGHTVVAVDGLKIEPLPAEISGIGVDGIRVPFVPIEDVETLYENLDERVMAGFGGVAEYGITVRWNKNYLKVIRLLLERRRQFALHGAVRLGGTLTVDQAFDAGFDHVALATGAGKPTVLPLPNGLARGVRAASDFLMALQLTGAARADTIANMQLRLPVVVIGGGLTAIDTATEAMAYYPVQVEKFLDRYEGLCADRGEDAVRAAWDPEELGIADEFLAHGRAIRAERTAAASEHRPAEIRELVQGWGGVTIAYRKRMIDSPSYTLNHEEVGKAFEEGIRLAEGLTPVAVEVDDNGHAEAITLAKQQYTREEREGHWIDTGTIERLPARAVLIAAGTQPNTVLAREDPTNVQLDGRFFQAIDETGSTVSPDRTRKPDQAEVLCSMRSDGRAISFFGDLHPSFAGNVVGALASSKQGYPVVSRMLDQVDPSNSTDDAAFLAGLHDGLRATVHAVNRLGPTIVEVVVRAPRAVAQFQPGQFYRLQNFETLAPKINGTTLAMEGIALTGAWVDKTRGLMGLIVLEMGGSSDLCIALKPGEPVVMMGPTGEPTDTPAGETVLLAGGGLGNAVLFSIGRALRAAGSKVLYFAAYRTPEDRFKVEEIEAASDVLIWCCDTGPGFTADRPQDKVFVGNVVQAMQAYGAGDLGDGAISMSDIDRIVTIGSDRMMEAVGQARHTVLAQYLKPDHAAIASINSPMQCMMKEICAQCLQPHLDPETGERTAVFSCFNQDQNLDHVDFPALRQRLRQNSVQEKLTALWVDKCLVALEVR